MSTFAEAIQDYIDRELSPQAMGRHILSVATSGVSAAFFDGDNVSPYYSTEVDGQEYQGIGSLLGVRESVFIKYSYVAQFVLAAVLQLQGNIAEAMLGTFFRIDPTAHFATEELAPNNQAAAYVTEYAAYAGALAGRLTGAYLTGGSLLVTEAGLPIIMELIDLGATIGARLSASFASSIRVSVDGSEVGMSDVMENKHPDAREIIVGSTVPYNRKIDIQMDNERSLHFTQPAGIYHDTVDALQQIFGDLVDVTRVDDWDFAGKYHPVHPFIFTSPAIRMVPSR